MLPADGPEAAALEAAGVRHPNGETGGAMACAAGSENMPMLCRWLATGEADPHRAAGLAR